MILYNQEALKERKLKKIKLFKKNNSICPGDEMVDMEDSKSSGLRRVGSSPTLGTIKAILV